MPINIGEEINLRRDRLRKIDGIGLELTWRIADNGPYKHVPHKPRVFQEDLRKEVDGIGRVQAGRIYRELVEGRHNGNRTT